MVSLAHRFETCWFDRQYLLFLACTNFKEDYPSHKANSSILDCIKIVRLLTIWWKKCFYKFNMFTMQMPIKGYFENISLSRWIWPKKSCINNYTQEDSRFKNYLTKIWNTSKIQHNPIFIHSSFPSNGTTNILKVNWSIYEVFSVVPIYNCHPIYSRGAKVDYGKISGILSEFAPISANKFRKPSIGIRRPRGIL